MLGWKSCSLGAAGVGALLTHTAAFAAPAKVPSAVRPVLIATLGGVCSKLKWPEQDISRFCASRMTNEEYVGKRIEFTFALPNGAQYSFSGNGLKQQKLNADTVLQPIDRLTMRMGGGIPPASTVANGECRYTNPYKGKAITRCIARASDGVSEAEFVSDGHAPTIQEF